MNGSRIITIVSSVVLILSFSMSLGFGYYKYVYAEDFDYNIESPCDGAASCYVRDCNTIECPPNGFSEYRLYKMSAILFDYCDDNSCKNICMEGKKSCREVICGTDPEDECVLNE